MSGPRCDFVPRTFPITNLSAVAGSGCSPTRFRSRLTDALVELCSVHSLRSLVLPTKYGIVRINCIQRILVSRRRGKSFICINRGELNLSLDERTGWDQNCSA